MNGHWPGKPPKPPLGQGDKQLGGPLLVKKDTKRRGVFNPLTCACTHTYPHAHTHTHAHTLAIAHKQHAKLAHACSSRSSSDSIQQQEWLTP